MKEERHVANETLGVRLVGYRLVGQVDLMCALLDWDLVTNTGV